ncbi:MAG: hypothetical protein HY866_07970 [Chloroflexi bacterium]|nr:hypothetical protein [Chloroflexota bacterium]
MSEQEQYDQYAPDEEEYTEEEYVDEAYAEDDSTGTDSAEPPRSLLQSWLVRITLGVVILIVLVAVVGGLVFSSQRSSRNKPLNLKVYPGATLLGSETFNDGFSNHDRRLYSVMVPVEEVEQFYDKQDDVSCDQYFGTVVGVFENSPEIEGHVYTRCIVDRSGWGITQYSTVLIQPMYDENQNPTGQVAIVIDRYWGD